MLTPLTQTAISLLRDIANEDTPDNFQAISSYPASQISELLYKLEVGGLIYREEGCVCEIPSSYTLCRSRKEISLLDILEATDEHLNCNHPTYESMYHQYRFAANKLGVINHMTRLYLSEIHLSDL